MAQRCTIADPDVPPTGWSGRRCDRGANLMDDHERFLDAARTAFARHSWADARAGFLAARASRPLVAADLEALAEAAWWEGSIDESLAASEDAYHLHLRGDAPAHRAAAMVAMDVGFCWFLRGEEAIGSGWLSRAERLLADAGDCVEQGYLQAIAIDAAIGAGQLDEAVDTARSIASMAERFGDETLCAYARVGEGIARIRQGQVPEGLAILDEAMLPVVAGRVRPTYAGNIYCQLMSVCHELSDVRRAGQWTDATARWCEGFSDAVMFIGVCRVHRAQLHQLRGQWAAAEAEIARVCDELATMNVVAVGLALYELAEVRRARGDLSGAEEAYRDAHRHGRDPQPGLALVRSAVGSHTEALDALLAAEGAAADRLARTRLWPAIIEVAIAAGDIGTARRACGELEAAASVYASSGLVAGAALGRGRLCLAEGDATAAIASLDAARQRWQGIGSPVHVAHARALLACAHAAAGNAEAAALERSAVTEACRELGINPPDIAGGADRLLPAGVTAREADVLRLVARGLTNREVADELVLSEKTVARHLANLYRKLGVRSRTAAAAWAYAHGLLEPPPA